MLHHRQEFKTLSQIVLEFARGYAGYLGIGVANPDRITVSFNLRL